MEKLIFREEQSFRQSPAIWIIVASVLIMLGGIGTSFYQQLYLGKPYGDEPISNNGLIWSSIGAFLLVSGIFVFMLYSRLTTEIWSDGVRYKFPPLLPKMRFIATGDIVSAEVGKYKPILEFGGWGWRRKMLGRKKAYNVSGRIGIRLIRKDGSTVMLGTRREEEMKRAVKKMMQTDTNKYSI